MIRMQTRNNLLSQTSQKIQRFSEFSSVSRQRVLVVFFGGSWRDSVRLLTLDGRLVVVGGWGRGCLPPLSENGGFLQMV